MVSDRNATNKVLRFVLILIGMWYATILPSAGQSVPDSIAHDNYALYYIRNQIDIDEDYLENTYQIGRIRDILARSPRIDSITIYAYASPEGSAHRNKWLAEKRAEAARKFILDNLPANSALLPENIHLCPMGENWQGLKLELERNYHRPNRNRVMDIMHANISTDAKKQRLQRLDNGHTYNLIINQHMPKLRLATWVCVYIPMPEVKDIQPVELPPVSVNLTMRQLPPFTPLPLCFPQDSVSHKTILALKTNLLYDALTLVNYSIEVPIANNFSALLYHQFPWWRWGKANNEYCIRFLSLGAEARWWFKPMPRPRKGKCRERDKLMGPFIGLYAESGKWDFELGRNICHQGEHWSTGLSFGYTMPIGRYINMEYSLSVGYASIPYRKFTPSKDYEILWRNPEKVGHWNYFGPTKAQVSLVLPIMAKSRKGGVR